MSGLYTSRNPYELLGDDDAPAVVAPKAVPVAKVAERKTPVGSVSRAPRKVVQADREDAPAANGDVKEERGNSTRGARGGRGGARGGRGASNPRSNGGTFLGGDRPRRENGGGRPFDKHSQTAHKDSDKASAAGWGAEDGKTELAAEEQGNADAKTDAAPVDGEAAKAAPAEKSWAAQVEEEEEDNSQTYDEYLAAQAANKFTIALPSARVANEGADESQWSTGVPVALKSAQDDEWFTGAKDTSAAKAKKVQSTKIVIEFQAQAYRPPKSENAPRGDSNGRGGRGGRGRGARGGRGGANGSAPRAPKVAAMNLNDASAFPSL